MPIETHTKEFNDRTFSYTTLSATNSLTLKYKLGALLGHSAKDVLKNLGDSDEALFGRFLDTITDVMARNNPSVIIDLMKLILKPVKVDGSQLIFDVVFAEDPSESYEVIFWVLQKEYEYFFARVVSLIATQTQTAETASPEDLQND